MISIVTNSISESSGTILYQILVLFILSEAFVNYKLRLEFIIPVYNYGILKRKILDMLDRGVARKLSGCEMKQYSGPVHYISHHDIMNPESISTPCRIVYNSSCNYKGHILNDYWAKGSSLINNLPGILLRFRENYIGVAGDIKKMYHAIKIS